MDSILGRNRLPPLLVTPAHPSKIDPVQSALINAQDYFSNVKGSEELPRIHLSQYQAARGVTLERDSLDPSVSHLMLRVEDVIHIF